MFPPAPSGAALRRTRAYQSPIVANGQVTFFTSACTRCTSLRLGIGVGDDGDAADVLALAVPGTTWVSRR